MSNPDAPSPAPAPGSHVAVQAATEALTRLGAIVGSLRMPRFVLPRLRLIPGVIFVAVLMLGVRTNDLVNGITAPAIDAGVPSQAQDAAPPAPETAEAAPEEAPQTEAQPEAEDAAETVAALPTEARSQTELDLLEGLSARRVALDEREQALDRREALLAVAEQRLAEKTTELEALRTQIEGMLGEVDVQREAQLASLVSIYENMRPADAATIFDGLDIDVLLNVLDRMREQKSAAILAGMNPERARQVTTELASRRQLPVAAVE